MELKEIAQDLFSRPGRVRGEVIRTNIEYIKLKEGEEGVRKIEEKMKELGSSLSFNDVSSWDWYPESENSLIVVIAKDVFNWSDKDVFEMGRSTVKLSFIMKMVFQYFVSPEKVFKEAPKYWKKHFDFGKIEIAEFNKEKKFVIIILRDFEMYPTSCTHQRGYFQGVLELVIKSKDIFSEELKCVHRGDPYHEHKITWN